MAIIISIVVSILMYIIGLYVIRYIERKWLETDED